jgi:tRNA modification GTPase
VAAPNNAAPSAPPDTITDTIHALSSGRPPAAIAVVRLSGPAAGAILGGLAGGLPAPRRAGLRSLRDRHGDLLDHALVLWFPGPTTATGEDLAELHLHGGRAVIEAVLAALADAGSRLAEPGEFTRRALLNDRLDLGEVEGLADLLAAETEYQRREALRRADGALGRRLAGWSGDLLAIAARIEAAIDYDGEAEDITGDAPIGAAIDTLVADIDAALSRVPAERLRDGLRIVIVGPPNAGKSSLFNAIVGRDAAIVSAIAGTTRDLIERPIAIAGMPFILIDTAGLREAGDEIERIGIARARSERDAADIVIDLEGGMLGPHTIAVSAKADIDPPRAGAMPISAVTGEGLDALLDAIATRAAAMLPGEGEVALDRRYRECLYAARIELVGAAAMAEPVLAAEHVRRARELLDGLTGSAGIEDMLDALFGRFCLGK